MLKQIPQEDRPMERLVAYGPSALSDTELLANIIRTGTRSANALQIAQRLVGLGQDRLSELRDASIDELMKYEGIGLIRACQISAAFELGRRSTVKKVGKGYQIRSPKELISFFQAEIGSEKVEKFVIVNLDTKSRVISWDTISVGILNASLVHPREIFRIAIRRAASAIIAFHNHPSGDCRPSEEDRKVTIRLAHSGKLVGIKLLDHIIIGDSDYYSFKENNYI